MILFLALLYAGGMWLVFFKLKLLPWNRKWITISVIVGIVGLTVIVLALNFSHPYSVDAVVMQKTTPIVPQVSGRIVELAVKSNQSVKKGDVLFKIDAEPYRESSTRQMPRLDRQSRRLQPEFNRRGSLWMRPMPVQWPPWPAWRLQKRR